VIICADDYGLREDIDAAILDLCHQGKLSAVSCMVALESCTPAGLHELRRYEENLDIGLHLCFTAEAASWSPAASGVMASAPNYGSLLKRSFLAGIDDSALQRQISVQYELFLKKMGRPPDHFDGHLHAHQLPGVRQAVIRFVLGLPQVRRPYVRNTTMRIKRQWRYGLPWSKALAIGFLGARFENMLVAAGVRTNQGFSGIYDFKKFAQYSSYFPRFAEYLSGKRDGILVVHPGTDEGWRKKEADVLQRFSFSPPPNRFRQ
jgi:predicted glycoside hydrolase/deacetylase ChbG (UPF0249 family)